MTNTSLADIQAAVSGDRKALEQLLRAIIPAIRASVIQTLIRLRYRSRGRDLEQEVEDLVHEAIMYLIDRDCRVLATWDPDRGMSLASFVSFTCGRYITKLVSREKSSPWTEDPTSMEFDEPSQGEVGSRGLSIVAKTGRETDPENIVSNKELFSKLVERLSRRLTPLGLQLFHMICVQSLSVDEICQRMDLSSDAVYAWRSRLTKTARKTLEDLLSEKSTPWEKKEKGIASR